jgi:selenocysteine lyase/cysteine desulfurase
MQASIELLLEIGVETVATRILALKSQLVSGLREQGFEILAPADGPSASGITTFTHADRGKLPGLYRHLLDHGVIPSFRQDRAGVPYLRFSPHFYNTEDEIGRVLDLIADAKPRS